MKMYKSRLKLQQILHATEGKSTYQDNQIGRLYIKI